MGPEVLVMSMRAWESLSARGPGDLSPGGPRSRASTCASLWRGLESNSRQQARTNGNTIIDNFDRKPFEKAMNSIYASAGHRSGLDAN